MKKLASRARSKALVLGSSAFCAFLWLTVHPTAGASGAVGSGRVADGASVYAANCVACHGSDGRAKTAKGKRSGATDLTSNWNADEARAIRIITNGKGEMPSFKGKLTKEEIAAVFGHILSFRH